VPSFPLAEDRLFSMLEQLGSDYPTPLNGEGQTIQSSSAPIPLPYLQPYCVWQATVSSTIIAAPATATVKRGARDLLSPLSNVAQIISILSGKLGPLVCGMYDLKDLYVDISSFNR